MAEPQHKRQKTDKKYELLYHPRIPGRGEYVRLALEATGTQFVDVANQEEGGYAKVQAVFDPKSVGDEHGNPPAFAPPILKVHGEGKEGKDLVISQTSNILLYLGSKLGLIGSQEHELYIVNEIALTALDLSDGAHDTHHPLASVKFYEDQKEAALENSKNFREVRIPKFFSYFERVLKSNEAEGKGRHLVGSKLTYADTTLWQVLDGVKFAFPKEVDARQDDYPLLLGTFYGGLKQEKWLAEYLESDRRLKYSMGVFRHYPELDRQ
ncbi:hypothetical protein ANO11243_028120 [Dothideomycetidae sp. 11243]|nr:hypothetical protein ANO11243_028120 [fungal sp. No.11243]